MSNEEWVLAIKLRLGLPLGIVSTNFKCICKGNPRVDQLGYHFMDCKHGGERHKTHDDLSSILVSMGRSAGVQCKLEPLLNSSVGSRRGDFLFIEPGIQFCKQVPELKDLANNVEVIGDVKVSFPSSKSYLNRKSYKHAGVAALDGYKKKLLKYHSGPDVLLGRGFIPISIEAFGRFHPSIKPFMSAICLKASAISGIRHSILLNYWTNRISASLQKNLAKMMLSRVDRILNASNASSSFSHKFVMPSHDELQHPHTFCSSSRSVMQTLIVH